LPISDLQSESEISEIDNRQSEIPKSPAAPSD
jgi:hypothetical protein